MQKVAEVKIYLIEQLAENFEWGLNLVQKFPNTAYECLNEQVLIWKLRIL